ncbi:hypothetical protein CBR_g24356 [Chara braunii]|uniref:Uncharacterized protein n=1 Tax=Chara braunii TaxID=69332 RepID=A0A388JMI4_CHABU|nr:hypothetical protein CBR_g24356 [Chara braunii]|eukprot:GBG59008.1 hypothetical protein CBR_g24356 [Chara braunii]
MAAPCHRLRLAEDATATSLRATAQERTAHSHRRTAMPPPPPPPCGGRNRHQPPSNCTGENCPQPPKNGSEDGCPQPWRHWRRDGDGCPMPPPPPCGGCNRHEPPSNCTGENCQQPPKNRAGDGCPPEPWSGDGDGCPMPPPPPCGGCNRHQPPQNCTGENCPQPPKNCTGDDCQAPPQPCTGGDDCMETQKPCNGTSCASCEEPLKDCDFFFNGRNKTVPSIKLAQKGAKIYTEIGSIVHQDGDKVRPVTAVNSSHCELLLMGSGGWSEEACHLRLYVNGSHIASREVNATAQPHDFLNRCIKIKINAAQYTEGGHYNGGQSNPRSCLVVRTANAFRD